MDSYLMGEDFLKSDYSFYLVKDRKESNVFHLLEVLKLNTLVYLIVDGVGADSGFVVVPKTYSVATGQGFISHKLNISILNKPSRMENHAVFISRPAHSKLHISIFRKRLNFKLYLHNVINQRQLQTNPSFFFWSLRMKQNCIRPIVYLRSDLV